MPEIVYTPSFHPGFIMLSDEFIVQHMPSANGTYVKVFLYAYQQYCAQTEGQGTEQIARALGMIESDVLEAFHYWEQKGLMHLKDAEGHLDVSFEPAGALPPTPPSSRQKTKPKSKEAADKVVKISSRPTYAPEELSLYQSMNPKIAALFDHAAEVLGAPLSPANLSILYSFYDYYCLPIEVIEYLMDYCIANGGRTMRYMEKVAQDWEEQKITSLHEAKAYVNRFTAYRPIMHALHLKGPKLSEKEQQYFSKWLDEYDMAPELVIEAANRTYANTGGPKLNYCDAILTRWHEEGVRSMEDIAASDEAFRQGAGTESEKKSKNAFLNYTPHQEWNYDELEQISRKQLYSEGK